MRRLRRPRAEQPLLTAVGIHVGHTITARRRASPPRRAAPAQDRAPSAAPASTPTPATAPRSAPPVGQLDQQRRARTRHEPLTLRRGFYRFEARRRPHLQGVLSWSRMQASTTRILAAREDA